MATMNKPAYAAIQTHSPTKPTLVFVSSRRQTRLTALDLIAYAAADERPQAFLRMDDSELDQILPLVKDASLRHTLQFGVCLHHAGLAEDDRALVERLFVDGKVQVLVATSTLAWGVNTPAHLVVVKGTEFFDAKVGRYVDYPITDVLQMMGRAGRPQYDQHGVAVIMASFCFVPSLLSPLIFCGCNSVLRAYPYSLFFLRCAVRPNYIAYSSAGSTQPNPNIRSLNPKQVHEPKKSFYKKFLYEPFPVESSLPSQLADYMNAEVVGGAVTSRQQAINLLTWTFFIRRLLQVGSFRSLSCCRAAAADPTSFDSFDPEVWGLKALCEKSRWHLWKRSKKREPPPPPPPPP
jgi:hypothetical protein